MPIYEYHCTDCYATFQKLRPMSKASEPAVCVRCGSTDTVRTISLFSAISQSSRGGSHVDNAHSGTGSGCASCAATNCAACSH